MIAVCVINDTRKTGKSIMIVLEYFFVMKPALFSIFM